MTESNRKISLSRWFPMESMDEVKKTFSDMIGSSGLNEAQISFSGKSKEFPSPAVLGESVNLTITKKKAFFSCETIHYMDSECVGKLTFDKKLKKVDLHGNIEVGNNFNLSKQACGECGKVNNNDMYVIDKENSHSLICDTCIHTHSKDIEKSFELFEYFLNDDFWKDFDIRLATDKKTLKRIPVQSFFNLATFLYKTQGFIKSSVHNSTKDQILNAILGVDKTNTRLISLINEKPSDETLKVIDIYKNSTSDSKYVKNIQSVLSSNFINLDDSFSTSILASAPSAYYTALNKSSVKNEPFGKVKERGTIKVRVNDIEHLNEKEYPVVKYRMSDSFGHKFVWNASSPGVDDLVVGGFFYMDATVKSHSEFKGVHYTMLARCAKIIPVEYNAPEPDFHDGAVKRNFKETYSFAFDFKNNSQEIDGHSYLLIKRSWREDKLVRNFNFSVKLPFEKSGMAGLVSLMASLTGVDRKDANGKVTTTHAKDKKFLKSLIDEAALYVPPGFNTEENLYITGDANPPLFPSSSEDWENPNSPSSESKIRKQRIFFSESEAVLEACKIQVGRLISAKIENWNPVVIPRLFNLIELEVQEAFKEQAIKNGYNALCTVDEIGDLKKIEPLGWHLNLDSISIQSVVAKHRDFEEGFVKFNNRALSKLKLAAICGSINEPLVAMKIKKILDENSDKYISKRNSIRPLPQLTENYLHPLRILSDDEGVLLGVDDRFIVIIDDSTKYYLEKFGVDMVSISISKRENTNCVDVTGKESLAILKEIKEAWELQLVDIKL